VLFRRVFFVIAGRSLATAGRSLFGERQAISFFPASCASFGVVSAFAVSHKLNLHPTAVT